MLAQINFLAERQFGIQGLQNDGRATEALDQGALRDLAAQRRNATAAWQRAFRALSKMSCLSRSQAPQLQLLCLVYPCWCVFLRMLHIDYADLGQLDDA